MEPAQLEYFRELLRQRRTDLMAEAAQQVGGMGDNGALFADPLDRAQLEGDRGFELRLRDRERKLIKKVEEAMRRIDGGTFGICEVCSEPIEEQRLKARPVTTLCIDCKEEQERLEKMEL